jgi:hypothetical protein
VCYSGQCINGTNAPDGTPCSNANTTGDGICSSDGVCSTGQCVNATFLPPGTLCGPNQTSFLCLTNPTCNNTGFCVKSMPKPVGTPCFFSTEIYGFCNDLGLCILNTTNSSTGQNITKIPDFSLDIFVSDNVFFTLFLMLVVPMIIFIIIIF